jgi:hypothetical protein
MHTKSRVPTVPQHILEAVVQRAMHRPAPTPDHKKPKMVEQARKMFAKEYPEMEQRNRCVHVAHTMCRVLQRHGIACAVVAGSANWECGEQTAFDGNYFGYKFDADEQLPKIASGAHVEHHAWVYIPHTREMVDITTRDQPEQAKQMVNADWDKGILPPDFLWCQINDPNHPYYLKHCTYIPNRIASAYVHQFLINNPEIIVVERLPVAR